MANIFPKIAYSPETTLATNINGGATTITVANVAVFPPAPNFATIRNSQSGLVETIMYRGISGNQLRNVVRAIEASDVARSWTVGTLISSTYTAYEHNVLVRHVNNHIHNFDQIRGTARHLPANTNLNTIFEGGFYRVNNATNLPSGAGSWIYLSVIQQGAQECCQIIYPFNNPTAMWIRRSDSTGAWEAWRRPVSDWNTLVNRPSTFAPSAHTHSASVINAGTFDLARIPNLPASRINSGTFDLARIPNLPVSMLNGVCRGVTGNWDDHQASGFYMGQNLLNAPPATNGSHSRWYVLVMQHNHSHSLQVATDFGNRATYQRIRTAGVWQGWVRTDGRDAGLINTGRIALERIPTGTGSNQVALGNHVHNASAINAGILPPARGGTGQSTLQATRNAMGLGNTTGVLLVANGGTGANNAAAARTNLGITPGNIGALSVGGGTITGDLTRGNMRLFSDGIGTHNNNNFIIRRNNAAFIGFRANEVGFYSNINTGGHRIRSQGTYTATGSNAGNVHINNQGWIFRTTSATKYKLNIRREVDLSMSEKLLELKPARWHDRAAVEALSKHLTAKANGEETSIDDVPFSVNEHHGLIAEDLDEVGLGMFVSRTPDGSEIEGIEYERLWTLLIPLVKVQREQMEEQNKIIKKLGQRVEALERKEKINA